MPKTTYVWDELSDNVAAEYENGVLAVGYTHEPGIYGNLLSQNRNGVTSYYHYDGRGDTVALTDDAGNVTDTKEYDAWGNVIASTGSTVTPYFFGGRRGYCGEVIEGSVYVRARVYQCNSGRWMSTDPAGIVDDLLLYSYAVRSPISHTDPSGNRVSGEDADKPIPNGGATWSCKAWETRSQRDYSIALDTCCSATLRVFVEARRCFEPGWEGESNPQVPNPTGQELSKHFFTGVRIRYVLSTFAPESCGTRKEWIVDEGCKVFPGRFLSSLTGRWFSWPNLPDPTELKDLESVNFSGRACSSVVCMPPGEE
jgi:RHS repeat-associated protein